MMTAYFAEDGATTALVRDMAWNTTTLGSSAAWPSVLRTTLSLIMSSRLPMCLWWERDHVFFCNDACVPLIGRAKVAAAFGRPAREHWHDNWRDIATELDSVLIHGRSTWHDDVPIAVEREGRLIDAYWSYGYSAVHDEAGVVRGALSTFMETTTQVLKARRLETLRRLLSELAESTDVDQLMLALQRVAEDSRADLPLLLVYRRARNNALRWEPVAVSRGVASAQVHSIGEVIAEHAGLARDVETPHLLTLPSSVALADLPEPINQISVAIPPSTHLYAVVIGVSPRLSCDNEAAAFFAQVTAQIDLSIARAGAVRERALVESERRSLLMQAPFPIAVLVGPSLVYELANPAYCAMVNRSELTGRAYLQVFPELEGSSAERVINRVYTTGKPFVATEYPVLLDRDHNGVLRDVYFHVIMQPIRDASGEISGLMVIAIDVSDQVTARHAAVAATEAMEAAMARKLALIDQLEAAAHAKDDFLAMVSHELRTPLTSILGWARVLQHQRDAARLDKGLATIERNAKAQAKLIDDMLDVSRIISGKARMNMRWVDARAIALAACEMIGPLVTAKAIHLNVQIDDALGWMEADEERLQQILWNLLSNAMKFTPQDGTISLRVTQDHKHTVFTVEDTGQGITPAFLPRVFERFAQDETNDAKMRAGLGLGLAIVRELVELHEGSVRAYSAGKDRGACFEVRIPTRSEHAKPASTTPPPRDASPPASTDALHDLHVLVVEDEDDARDFIATVLTDAGAQVTQIDSAQQALTMLRDERFDVLVSDIGMPHEDGYALITGVRADTQPLRIRGIPALALTAFSKPEDRRRALAAGFQDHLAKPIDAQQLIDRVAALAHR